MTSDKYVDDDVDQYNENYYKDKWEKDDAFVTTWKFSINLLDDDSNDEKEKTTVQKQPMSGTENQKELIKDVNNCTIGECSCNKVATTPTEQQQENISSCNVDSDDTNNNNNNNNNLLPTVPNNIIQSFQKNGFIVFTQSILSTNTISELNIQLEELLRGRYNTGNSPDKVPKLLKSEYIGSQYHINTMLQKQKQQSQQQQVTNDDSVPPDPTTTTVKPTTTTSSVCCIKSDLDCDDADNDCNGTCNGNEDTDVDDGNKNSAIKHSNANQEMISTIENDTNNSTTTTKTNTTYIRKEIPKAIIGPIGFSGNYNNVRVIQIINAQKASIIYKKLATNPILGKVVCDLMGWTQCGVRFVQDQIWAKPPYSSSLTFHRDTPYFMFNPNTIVTVWIALDTMYSNLGPIQYVRKSHMWTNERHNGTAQQFFNTNNGIDLLKSAATYEIQSLQPQLTTNNIPVHSNTTTGSDTSIATANGSNNDSSSAEQQKQQQCNTTSLDNASTTSSSSSSSSSHMQQETQENGEDIIDETKVTTKHTSCYGKTSSDSKSCDSDVDKSTTITENNNDLVLSDLLDIVSVEGIPAGAISIHYGTTWHGSLQNTSKYHPRRGIGLHYAPIDIKFTWDAIHSIQWKQYLQHLDINNPNHDPASIILPLDDFPIPYAGNQQNESN